ncbi:hypothetical protein ACERZ8_07615 [Tateyamaria armeniaca]|uniref:Flp pilus assembly protein CpaB n=1 Tax=Tateyamaria armeniaca TaxID=2518930 RepID=A0ABW8URJ1_9RHOB
MTGIQRTLLAILAFVGIAVGLFIWFIANWDKDKTQPIGMAPGDSIIAGAIAVRFAPATAPVSSDLMRTMDA